MATVPLKRLLDLLDDVGTPVMAALGSEEAEPVLDVSALRSSLRAALALLEGEDDTGEPANAAVAGALRRVQSSQGPRAGDDTHMPVHQPPAGSLIAGDAALRARRAKLFRGPGAVAARDAFPALSRVRLM